MSYIQIIDRADGPPEMEQIEMTYTIEQLTSVGGSEWRRDDMHRVYFNDLLDLCEGLEYATNRKGAYRGAALDDKTLSRKEGLYVISTLNVGKFYYDVTTGTFETNRIPAELVARLRRGIERRLQDVPPAPEPAQPLLPPSVDYTALPHVRIDEMDEEQAEEWQYNLDAFYRGLAPAIADRWQVGSYTYITFDRVADRAQAVWFRENDFARCRGLSDDPEYACLLVLGTDNQPLGGPGGVLTLMNRNMIGAKTPWRIEVYTGNEFVGRYLARTEHEGTDR